MTQYWPRGVPRSRVDEYVRTLAPSRELVRAFKDGLIAWTAFRDRYIAEMQRPEAETEVRRLADLARREDITLLCVCREGEPCHRLVLRDLVQQAMRG